MPVTSYPKMQRVGQSRLLRRIKERVSNDDLVLHKQVQHSYKYEDSTSYTYLQLRSARSVRIPLSPSHSFRIHKKYGHEDSNTFRKLNVTVLQYFDSIPKRYALKSHYTRSHTQVTVHIIHYTPGLSTALPEREYIRENAYPTQ